MVIICLLFTKDNKGGEIFMIQKIKVEYKIFSEKGRNIGTYRTEEQARKRLQQIEYFRRQK